jgi:hypothetical protein
MIGLNLDPIFCRGWATKNNNSKLENGDEVTLRVEGGARHTGIEIQEFINLYFEEFNKYIYTASHKYNKINST